MSDVNYQATQLDEYQHNDLIQIAGEEGYAFVYVPPRLNKAYLEGVLSASRGNSVTIKTCRTTNLCSQAKERVSNNGATVLRLSLELGDGESQELVAKILCPDTVNLFQLDKAFSRRKNEIHWARWWAA